jgi:TonB family protein
MRAPPRESKPAPEGVVGPADRAHEERTTRKAWSMVAAVAVHAAALASWPSLPNQLSLALDPTQESTLEGSEPEWVFMDQVGGRGSQTEGDGATRAPRGTGAVPVAPRGVQTVSEDDIDGLSDALRDRLVRSTSFAPSLSEPADPLGVLPSRDNRGGDAAGAALAGLSPSDYETLEELSALDLARLSAIRPEVALEASSNWVLVRNPVQVRDFILRHPSNSGERIPGRGAVSVAIWVSAAGSVEWAEIITSSGKSEWDDLALELFNDVVMFRPARLEGVPMPMSAIFTVDFPW